MMLNAQPAKKTCCRKVLFSNRGSKNLLHGIFILQTSSKYRLFFTVLLCRQYSMLVNEHLDSEIKGRLQTSTVAITVIKFKVLLGLSLANNNNVSTYSTTGQVHKMTMCMVQGRGNCSFKTNLLL